MTKINEPFRAHYRVVMFLNTSGRKLYLTGRDPSRTVDLITARAMQASRVRARTSRGMTAETSGGVTLLWRGRTNASNGTLIAGTWIEDADYPRPTAVTTGVFLDKPPMPLRVMAEPPVLGGIMSVLTRKHVRRVAFDSPTLVPGYNLFRPLGRHGDFTRTEVGPMRADV